MRRQFDDLRHNVLNFHGFELPRAITVTGIVIIQGRAPGLFGSLGLGGGGPQAMPVAAATFSTSVNSEGEINSA